MAPKSYRRIAADTAKSRLITATTTRTTIENVDYLNIGTMKIRFFLFAGAAVALIGPFGAGTLELAAEGNRAANDYRERTVAIHDRSAWLAGEFQRHNRGQRG